MALPDFLSALRQLILDNGLPTGTPESRRSQLSARFPKLTPQEVGDFLAMPTDRLAVYTDLVFAGQRGTLEWIYPATLAAIHRLEGLPEASREARHYDFEMSRDLHRHKSWSDSSTRSLARGFEDYLLNQRADLVRRWPGLAELARFERIELEVFYAPDEMLPRTRPEQLETLTQLSVEALMMLQVMRPACSQIHDFACDVLAIADFLRRNSTLPDPLPGPQPLVAACGRSIVSLSPQWIRLDAAQSAALGRAAPQEPLPINDLAEAYLAELPPDPSRTDQRAFEDYFTHLVAWLQAGVLMLCPAR
jgi:hypothetical protein